jgi:hypothetical protein
MIRLLRLLWCRIRRHDTHAINCCNGAHSKRYCWTCHGRSLDAAYDSNAYKLGQHIWYDGKEMVIRKIHRPTTLGSKAWLSTAYASSPNAFGGVGAPDTYFGLSKEESIGAMEKYFSGS